MKENQLANSIRKSEPLPVTPGSRSTASSDTSSNYFDRELSWLNFAGRVLALVEDNSLPLLERVKFAGIMGVLHDEFFMKRVNVMKRRLRDKSSRLLMGGRTPKQQLVESRQRIVMQAEKLATLLSDDIFPALHDSQLPIYQLQDLDEKTKKYLREYYIHSVEPILTPLAVDAEHPFPFISNGVINLGLHTVDKQTLQQRFVRVKCPENRPRWVALPDRPGVVPLEQVIAEFLVETFPVASSERVYFFRVTRGVEGKRSEEVETTRELNTLEPGSIVRQVSDDLRERRFAPAVQLQVDRDMPEEMANWIAKQVKVDTEDVYRIDHFLSLRDLLELPFAGHDKLLFPRHTPVPHPRLRNIEKTDHDAFFREIAKGDILLHHPYHSFDSSVLRFIRNAAYDPQVLAIKLTIYRTNQDSPIVQALAEASRRGKQVAVVVEITARFDEAPNIAWGKFLESEGVHVAYGVEKLKTHVKLALVVREEDGKVSRYAHVGTGNYHSGTARAYEDLGILTANPDICEDAATVFNDLTGATQSHEHRYMLVAPLTMRNQFLELIRRETENARQGKPSGIDAKMNQLQDRQIIDELYNASQAGVPIRLVVRGLCCLRPGVPDLSENISVISVLGRFLEHSRIYRFHNGGSPEYFIGSADWMRRNLTRRVETIIPVLDEAIQAELGETLEVYFSDNESAWVAQPDGTYARRQPLSGEPERNCQRIFIDRSNKQALGSEIELPENGHTTSSITPMPDDFS